MRERRYLTFDMENPRHREAFSILSAQSGRLRSEYVIDCILKAEQDNRMEDTIRQMITETLKDISLSVPATKSTPASLQTTESLSDLPEVLLTSLEEI